MQITELLYPLIIQNLLTRIKEAKCGQESCAITKIFLSNTFSIKQRSVQQFAISSVSAALYQVTKQKFKERTNMLSMKSILSLTFVVLLIFTISSSVDAAFKKLPLNGSMFGKRGTSIGEFSIIFWF